MEIGCINISAGSIGIAQAALDQALSYAKQRHAFGQPISEYPARRP